MRLFCGWYQHHRTKKNTYIQQKALVRIQAHLRDFVYLDIHVIYPGVAKTCM